MSGAAPASAPAVTSLCPFRYFVAECMTRSTPSAIGCWLIGLAKVLSMADIDAARAAGRGDVADVHAAQRRIDRRLEPEDPRRRSDDALRRGQILERREASGHAKALAETP